MEYDPSKSGTFPAPRKPALAKCSPERYAAHVAVAEWFAAWCAGKHISVRDRAEILGVTIAVARAKLTGDSPLGLVDVAQFPARYRSELILGLSVLFQSSDLRAHG